MLNLRIGGIWTKYFQNFGCVHYQCANLFCVAIDSEFCGQYFSPVSGIIDICMSYMSLNITLLTL
jgi:hypothetical protein